MFQVFQNLIVARTDVCRGLEMDNIVVTYPHCFTLLEPKSSVILPSFHTAVSEELRRWQKEAQKFARATTEECALDNPSDVNWHFIMQQIMPLQIKPEQCLKPLIKE